MDTTGVTILLAIQSNCVDTKHNIVEWHSKLCASLCVELQFCVALDSLHCIPYPGEHFACVGDSADLQLGASRVRAPNCDNSAAAAAAQRFVLDISDTQQLQILHLGAAQT